MINRSIAPVQNPIEHIEFVKAQTVKLPSGVLCHSVMQEDCKVVEFEVEFDAGSKFQEKALVAAMVNNLLMEGSANYSAFEIASFFDNEGAFVEASCNADKASVVLHCLEKSIPKLLPFLHEVIMTANFPQVEIENYLTLNKQRLQVNLKKVAWVARNEFMEQLLGKEHPYSWKIEMEDYEQLKKEDLVSFYDNYYKTSNCQIYIAGKVTTSVINVVEEVFGQKKTHPFPRINLLNESSNESKEFHVVEQDGAIQSAIRLGVKTINRKHEDFPALFAVNTILGGYFGSRLMSNIREDKGYTYGIGSGIIHFNQLSYFVVSTEVGVEVTKPTLKEIEFEMNTLQEKLVSLEELSLVKNYILGNIMKGFDGSFSAMSRFKMLNQHGLDYGYYESLVQEVNEITPEKVKAIAQRYLNFSELKKIIVGKL